jgi:hypothetical protein
MLVTISTKNFKTKPKDELRHLTYSTEDVTPTQLLDKVMSGYCFQNHYDYKGEFQFKGIGAKTKHYIGSYVISIDIDHQERSMRDMLTTLDVKPSFCYETFSNKVGDYCFRLCYCFSEEIYGKELYSQVYKEICKRNKIEKYYDKKASDCYHYFNGTTPDSDSVNFSTVYTLKDFGFEASKGVGNIIIRNGTFDVDKDLDGKGFYSDELVKDLETIGYDGIVSKYHGIYRHKQSSPVPKVSEDVKVIPLPRDFYEIVRPWASSVHKGESNIIIRNGTFEKGYIKKLKNGEHRRETLYNNLCIRRLILPDLTLDELLYAGCYEMSYFIDNSDKSDIITKRQVMSIVLSAYKRDLSTFNYVRPRESMVNWLYCKKYGVTKQEVASQIANEKKTQSKENKKELFFQFYNVNLTIKENIEEFTEKTGIKVSERTVKRWKSELNMTREYNKEPQSVKGSECSSNIIIRNGTFENNTQFCYPTFDDSDNGMLSDSITIEYAVNKPKEALQEEITTWKDTDITKKKIKAQIANFKYSLIN